MAKTIEEIQSLIDNQRLDSRQILNLVVDYLQENPGGPGGTASFEDIEGNPADNEALVEFVENTAGSNAPFEELVSDEEWDLDTNTRLLKTLEANLDITLTGGVNGSSGVLIVNNPGTFTLTINGVEYPIKEEGRTSVSVFRIKEDDDPTDYYIETGLGTGSEEPGGGELDPEPILDYTFDLSSDLNTDWPAYVPGGGSRSVLSLGDGPYLRIIGSGTERVEMNHLVDFVQGDILKLTVDGVVNDGGVMQVSLGNDVIELWNEDLVDDGTNVFDNIDTSTWDEDTHYYLGIKSAITGTGYMQHVLLQKYL